MVTWFFVSDLHGQVMRYQKLHKAILTERPAAVLIGGDLLPPTLPSRAGNGLIHDNFVHETLKTGLGCLQEKLGASYPRVYIILGNDDPRSTEVDFIDPPNGMWEYINCRRVEFGGFSIYGYAYVPPTPFFLKDWERYDVSRFVDPGCISPEEGWRSTSVPANEVKFTTIQMDLKRLVGNDNLTNAIFLFHTPPYQTALDRAALDGQAIDKTPLDTHMGSIAVRRFIVESQPLITLHGHIHESPRLTGSWKDRLGRTFLFSAAHDGRELSLVRFDPEKPENASRELI
jgi:Icc-related predicted phosphoesterase